MIDTNTRGTRMTASNERDRLCREGSRWEARAGKAAKRGYNRRMRHNLNQALAAMDFDDDLLM